MRLIKIFLSSLFIISLVLLTFSIHTASANKPDQKNKTIQVEVDSLIKPDLVTGLIISENGAKEVAVASVTKVSEVKTIVVLSYDQSDFTQNAMATAMIMSKTGEVAFSNVKPLFYSSMPSYLNIPKCSPETITEINLESHLSILDSLVDVRAKRRREAILTVAQILNGEFLARLQKIEESFGLETEPQLGIDLTPVVLTSRLSKILEAIRNYEAYSKGKFTVEQ